MKKIAWVLGLSIIVSLQSVHAQDLDAFIRSASDQIQLFLKDQINIRSTIVKLENYTDLSDNAVQHVYQVLASTLEGNNQLHFSDLMVGYTAGHAEFNLRSIADFNFWIDVKLIRNGTKVGIGITIFSKRLDKIVFLKYLETILSKGELDLINTKSFAFSELGFSKTLEMEAKKDLLDIASTSSEAGVAQYYFLYPKEIVCFESRQNRLQKIRSIPLQWERPFYPTQFTVGRLLIFKLDQTLYLSAGLNSSPNAQIFERHNDAWEPWAKVDFLPLKLAKVNQILYLLGARYELGTDIFKDKLVFLQFTPDHKIGQLYEKKVMPFYALDAALSEGQLESVHMIDNNFRYHMFATDLTEKILDEPAKGSALAVFENHWLAVSDNSVHNDRLFFYSLTAGGRRLVYNNSIAGEIVFLTSGSWAECGGFWVLIKNGVNSQGPYQLQFWGKK